MRIYRDVMVNFEPWKHEKNNFSVSGTRGSEKSRTYDLLVTSADPLPLCTIISILTWMLLQVCQATEWGLGRSYQGLIKSSREKTLYY